jgi:hypothetical protein
MSKLWPPPPDLDSLKELFATADVEGLMADDCPMDEYDPEAKRFFEATVNQPSESFVMTHTLPILETMWTTQFMLDDTQLAQRRPALTELAQQIERFFGPEAKPQVRNVSN